MSITLQAPPPLSPAPDTLDDSEILVPLRLGFAAAKRCPKAVGLGEGASRRRCDSCNSSGLELVEPARRRKRPPQRAGPRTCIILYDVQSSYI